MEDNEPKFGILWRIILGGLAAVAIIVVAVVVIGEGSVFLAELTNHIASLFRDARLNPNNQSGFAKLVQLILIAIFAGWAYTRFKRKK